MQFHDHGYVSGDPRVQPAEGRGIDRAPELPDVMDVLIVGSGPAGMTAAAQLAQFPDVETRIIDRRPGRLEIGQADGIQARSVETFEAFGFAGRIVEEAYAITEMAFWKPDPADPERIYRAAVAPDDPHGISEYPHLIVNQARVLDYFAEFAANSPARVRPDYGWEFVTLEVEDGEEHPVRVTLKDLDGAERIVRAKYVLGGDGARSRVRDAIGAKPVGNNAFHAWGVMDILWETDFPDIRTKCAIQSNDGGSILLIPREGGYLVRMYVDLGEVAADDNHAVRNTSIETIIATANDILSPYTLEVREVAWWSVYEVGHRVTDRFDDVPVEHAGAVLPRVFIAGDACHTHSAKAGQGMNVSIQDGWNLSWKLGHVLSGLAPENLLSTYSAERQIIAQNLIDFDKEWSTMMAKRPEEFEKPSDLEDFYVRTAEFPAGFMTEYQETALTIPGRHQELATGYPIGKRFRSARASRVADGNPVHLGHHHRADGRWRIYAFADTDARALNDWAEWLGSSADSPLARFTPSGADTDALFDVKVVYQQPHGEIEVPAAPAVFRPVGGPLRLTDYEKVYATHPTEDIFEARGVAREGAVVVVRPDHYVSAILPLSSRTELTDFFAGVLRDAS